jgi:parallel beta-helix repeat protein
LAITTQDTIYTDETWSGVIAITGNLTVIEGMLRIQPGTYVTCANNQIILKIKGNGALSAIGTAQSPITFCGGCISFDGLLRDSISAIQYCLFRDNYHLIDFRNTVGIIECSRVTIDHCTFYNGGFCIYVTSNASPIITNCTMRHGDIGVFVHGGVDVAIQNCTISDMCSGIVSVSLNEIHQDIAIDHVTIYDVDTLGIGGGVVWARGLGLYCGGQDPGTITITNSIIAKTEREAISVYNPIDSLSWIINDNYNCYFENALSIGDCNLGDHSIEADPLFSQPDSGNFSLTSSSPCWQTASDGTHRGAWQSDSVPTSIQSPLTKSDVSWPVISQDDGKIVFTDASTAIYRLSVFNIWGEIAYHSFKTPNTHSIVWDVKRNVHGTKVDIYIVRMELPISTIYKKILVNK